MVIGRFSSEMAELFPLTYSRGRSAPYSSSSHDLYATIPRFFEGVYFNSFFPQSPRLLPRFFACRTLSFNLWSKWFYVSYVDSADQVSTGICWYFVVKSKLSFCSGSILLRKLIPIYQKGTWSLFLIKLLFLYSYWT